MKNFIVTAIQLPINFRNMDSSILNEYVDKFYEVCGKNVAIDRKEFQEKLFSSLRIMTPVFDVSLLKLRNPNFIYDVSKVICLSCIPIPKLNDFEKKIALDFCEKFVTIDNVFGSYIISQL